MEDFDIRLKDKEKAWIRVYFESGGNASEATRAVYGGTPLSCRVKGHKRLTRLNPVICDFFERGFDQMANGVDLYLSDLERGVKEKQALTDRVKRTRGSKRSQRLTQAPLCSAKEGENG